MILTHAGINIADSTSYYFGGVWGSQPTSVGNAYYRNVVPRTGTITEIFVSISIGGTLATAEDATLTLLKAGSTLSVISATIKNNAAHIGYSFKGLNIPVTEGDQLSIKWDTPAFVTNPIGVTNIITLFIQ